MQIPPIKVITWPQPNYVDPVTRGPTNAIVSCLLYSIVCVFLLLRLFTRLFLSNSFGVDDTLLLLAWIPTTVFFVVSLVMNHQFHWDRHIYDIPANDVSTALKIVLAIQVVFAFAVTLTKLSMLALTRRITTVCSSRIWHKITTGAIFLVSIQGIVFCLAVTFQCRPISAYWTSSDTHESNCIDQTSIFLAAGIINTLTDILVVMLPLHTVWNLKLPDRQQTAVKVLFAFGFCSCAAGIVRTYFVYQTTTSRDQTWSSYPVWLTSGIELYLGVICASIPATKLFFSSYLPSLLSSAHSLSPIAGSNSGPHILRSRPTTIDTEEKNLCPKEDVGGIAGYS